MLERQKEQIKHIQDNSHNRLEEIIVEILFVIFFIAFNLFELYLIYLLGYYCGAILEISIILLYFLINKALFGIPLHFMKTMKCLFISFIAFYIAIKCAVSPTVSLFINVLVGVTMGAVTSYIATYLYREKAVMKKRNLVKELLALNLKSIEHILDLCKIFNLDEEIGYMVEYRLTHSEDLTCYEFSVDRSTLNRKLNKFLKAVRK